MMIEPSDEMDRKHRENDKERGRQMLREGQTLEERTEGAALMIGAYHDYSMEKIRGHRSAARHPDFAAYVRMVDPAAIFGAPPDVVAELRRRFGPALDGGIESGDVCWRPRPRSHRR